MALKLTETRIKHAILNHAVCTRNSSDVSFKHSANRIGGYQCSYKICVM